MNAIGKIAIVFFILALFIGCRKEPSVHNSSCSTLLSQFRHNDKAETIEALQARANQLGRIPLNSSFQDVTQLLQKFAGSLRNDCGINAEVLCTMCIYTLPAQSEISITYTSNGIRTQIVVDLSSEEGKPLQVVNIHE